MRYALNPAEKMLLQYDYCNTEEEVETMLQDGIKKRK